MNAQNDQIKPIELPYASLYRWLVFLEVFAPKFRNVPTLDIGCNNGGFLTRMLGDPKMGLDRAIYPEALAHGLHVVCGDATRLPYRSELFEQIILFDLIEHVEDDRAVLREACRVLAPGGVMWISTPALDYRLFPRSVTARAARSWGHVRNGYTAEELIDKLPREVAVETVYWNEPVLRTVYVWLRAMNLISPRLARGAARACFRFDRHRREGRHGHLLAKVTK